jgi:predicted N-acyltransferase
LGLFFQIYDHNVRWKEVADFLKMLHRHLRRKFIVVMDRFNAHRKAVRVLQAQHPHWFEDDLGHLHRAVTDSLEDIGRDPALLRSFFCRPPLAL